MLVGITGKKRAGKDTAGRYIAATQELFIDSFAAPIRRFMCDILQCTLDQLERIKEDPHPILEGRTPREFMQYVGTEIARQFTPNIWVNALDARLKGETVITDLRFDNEAAYVQNRGGMVIQIERPGTAGDDAHASERGVSPSLVDIKIKNDGTVHDLQRQLDQLFP